MFKKYKLKKAFKKHYGNKLGTILFKNFIKWVNGK